MTVPERPEFSLEYVPLEVSFPNQGDYREPSVQIRMGNGLIPSADSPMKNSKFQTGHLNSLLFRMQETSPNHTRRH